ncbi:unnamed protein product [Leptosia nina]|uniref:Uncharacterized protein n=1 Tax=Leptosia nina TaxID=320188 RepID=A0AAV1JP42_9NEOP
MALKRATGCSRALAFALGSRGTFRASTTSGARDSCAPTEPPACPPCESPRPPPCRRPADCDPRAVRVVCCAPPASKRPPCPETPPACALTCQNRQFTKDARREGHSDPCKREDRGECSTRLDHVASRLAAAEKVRRTNYESEAARHATGPVSPSPAIPHYTLAGERTCARATDGRDYMCQKTPNAPRACSADRTPPPPEPVGLASSEGCDVQGGRRLDPCAHRPRVFVEIDRSANAKATKSDSVTKESLTTRLFNTMKLKKSTQSACPRRKCKEENDWCETPPRLGAVPLRCRESSLAERLHRRRPRDQRDTPRSLHTSAHADFSRIVASPIKNEPSFDKISVILREREAFLESGRGRSVGLVDDERRMSKKSHRGSLELPVPFGAGAVKVRVTLDYDLKEHRRDSPSTKCVRGSPDSWLSIQNIRSKFSGCKKGRNGQPRPPV